MVESPIVGNTYYVYLSDHSCVSGTLIEIEEYDGANIHKIQFSDESVGLYLSTGLYETYEDSQKAIW